MKTNSIRLQSPEVLLILAFASTAFLSGCLQTKSLESQRKLAAQSPLPKVVNSQMRKALEDFGKMVRVHTGHDEPVVVEVDLMPNDTGIVKELPKEIGTWVVGHMTVIGKPFATVRPFDSNITLDSIGAAQNPLPRPAHAFTIRGQLQRGSDRLVRKDDWRAGAVGRIEGGDADAQIGTEKRVTVRNYRMQMYLADGSGKTLAIPAASYEVWQSTQEQAANLSVYYEGCGGGYNGAVLINQDAGDALSDATAACVIELLGRLLKVPYHQTSPVFSEYQDASGDLLAEFTSMQPAYFDFTTKRIAYTTGINVDLSNPRIISDRDRKLITATMDKAGLDFAKRKDRERFLAQLWKQIDWRKDEPRVEQWLQAVRDSSGQSAPAATASSVRQSTRSDLPLPEQEPTRRNPTGSWQGTPTLNLDLTEIGDKASRETIIQALIAAEPSMGISGPNNDLFRCQLRYSGNPVIIQRALRRVPGLAENYQIVWMDAYWHELRIIRPREMLN